jgi:DNA-binding response OmpR family regulator
MTGEQGKKILLIQDGPMGEKLEKELAGSRFLVTHVKMAREGFNALCNVLPHLVIVDVSLPEETAYTFLAEKQAEPLLAVIPVFLISSGGDPIHISQIPEKSVLEYLTSVEVGIPQIMSKVNELFSREEKSNKNNSKMPPEEKKIRILWVEDDKLIGSILFRKLSASGFEVNQVKNGEDGLKQLETFVPDLIMVDLILPGMSGFDFLQAINGNPKLASVPRIVLSNLSKVSDVEKTKALGAKKFLVKAAMPLDQIAQELRSVLIKP